MLELTAAEKRPRGSAFETCGLKLAGALIGGLKARRTAMATGRLQAFNFQKWIDENQHLLKLPVGNKKVSEDGDMTAGGRRPNERRLP
jgi:hypothetical protein